MPKTHELYHKRNTCELLSEEPRVRQRTYSEARTNLQAKWQLMDPCGQSSNLAVGQDARAVRVDLIKHFGHIEPLLSAHQEVEV